MTRLPLVICLLGGAAQAHDIITTPITYSREIYRIFQARCFTCHRPGGSAFSLMTYSEARPWAEAIKEEVLARTMPPWGAVKGFGDFRNDRALTPEQIEVIESWADGGVPEGEPSDLPNKLDPTETWPSEEPRGGIAAGTDFKLTRPLVLDGLMPAGVPEKASFQVTAELPDGSVEPLIWIENYSPKYAHSFRLRMPLDLPAGTFIRGIPADATIRLLPAAPVGAASVQSGGKAAHSP
ncbi:MAG TPA: cytochrome c [Bryobacteraceae bacterium]|nr:cytochrome c [Bryobacteraceae bacterium]